jgi:hypothetical protein
VDLPATSKSGDHRAGLTVLTVFRCLFR